MKRLLLLMLLLITVFQSFSQTKGISYQAVILNPQEQELPGVNAQGNILANSAVSIQFTIVNALGTEVYQEKHSTNTDSYGMINLLIGAGTPRSGNDFENIVWDGTPKNLKVGIDFSGGSNFSPLSEQKLTYMPHPSTAVGTSVTDAINDGITTVAPSQNAVFDALVLKANLASPTFTGTVAGISNTMVGLGNVDNTSDVNKPVSIATQTALDGKVDENATITGDTKTKITYDAKGLVTAGSDATTTDIIEGTNLYYTEARVSANTAVAASTSHATQIDNPHSVTKGQVGLENVDNTSDVNKPVSIATQTALDGKVDENAPIIGGTKTKITYDAKGLVTAGSDATTTDIIEGTNLYYTEARVSANADVVANTAKTGITSAQATTISNTTGVNTGDQDISGIATNAGDISTIQGEQTTQNNAIALNTAKTGITTAQATTISNTTGVNTGDQDISGIATNAGDISTIQGEQTTQNTAIALNTAKTGITTVQATTINNTTGVNTGDQDISGIATNAGDISTIQGEQTTQNTAIALNTAKTGITTAQATTISNTTGVNTGDNATNTLYSGLVTNAAHTGDVTGGDVLTLATVNSNVGSFNTITINAKGLATAGSNVSYLTSETDPIVKAINGIVKSDGTAISTAIAGTDYLAPNGSAALLTTFPTLNQNTTGNAATVTTNADLTGDVTSTGNATTIANKTTMTATAPVSITGSPTVIASSAVAISIAAATTSTAGSMSAVDKTKLDGLTNADGSETKVLAGTNVTVTGTGTIATPYVINSTGGVLAFAEFYAMMPGDNAATVAAGTAVDFPQNGPNSNSGITRLTATTFQLAATGTYMVIWQVSIDEPGQLVLVLDGTQIARTVVGRAMGTTQITGNSLITTTSSNSILSVNNPAGNPTALIVTPSAGGASPVSATLMITRIQ